HRQSLSLCRFLRFLSTEAPSLHRHYPVSTVLRASPSPHTARPGSRELPVDPNLPSPLGLPVLRLVPCVCMPSPLPRQVRWNRFAHDCSIVVGLPQITVGSAPALSVSRPAQRSLALQPADLPGRLMRPSTPEAPAALLPPPPLRLLPGGAIQFPGGFISRCGPVPFTAHCNRLIASVDNFCASRSGMVGRSPRCYCRFAYSALASFRMGMDSWAGASMGV